MSDHAELDLTDPWTVWGLEMGRLMQAAGIPPDEDLLRSVASLVRLRHEVEAKEVGLAGALHPVAGNGRAATVPGSRLP